jgi:hypothetical protein
MRKPCAILVLTAILFGSATARAADHVVLPGTLQAHLAGSAAERAHDIAVIEDALSSPKAKQAATMAGVDIDTVRGSLAQLSDSEARDLARRADALRSDPTAGHYGDDDAIELLVVVALIGAIALVVIEIADDNHR